MQPKRKYWIVQRYGEEGHCHGQKYKRYYSQVEAHNEAQHMARIIQAPFVVLEAVACLAPVQVQEVKLV